jgi:hypothetical protein
VARVARETDLATVRKREAASFDALVERLRRMDPVTPDHAALSDGTILEQGLRWMTAPITTEASTPPIFGRGSTARGTPRTTARTDVGVGEFARAGAASLAWTGRRPSAPTSNRRYNVRRRSTVTD